MFHFNNAITCKRCIPLSPFTCGNIVKNDIPISLPRGKCPLTAAKQSDGGGVGELCGGGGTDVWWWGDRCVCGGEDWVARVSLSTLRHR